jgi:serine/threonine protein kinase
MPSPGCTPLLRSDPRSIGRYRILGRLGAGGMATVYLAGEVDGGYVALKLVHEHLAADAEFRDRFARETQLAARVPEHCTAALRDSGVHDDRPYLVTEYLDGPPLSRLVDDEGPLDPSTLHNVAVGLAAGLTAIHDCDLVHRDIKPSNVVITRGGVRIIDFGIARTLATATGFTQSGVVMGSLGWTSPEQLAGREPMPAMDVFAWGCVIAYAATGRHPFGGDDTMTRSWRILNAEPDLDGVPGVVAELVGAALERDTERRPTAQELLLGLVGGAGSVVTVRPAVPAASKSGGRPQRRRRWAVLIGVVSIGLAAVVAFASGAGGGHLGRLDAPAGTSPSATGGSPPASGDSSRPVGQTGPGQTPAPTAPPTVPPNGAGGADAGQSAAPTGTSPTKSKKPKKSKEP